MVIPGYKNIEINKFHIIQLYYPKVDIGNKLNGYHFYIKASTIIRFATYSNGEIVCAFAILGFGIGYWRSI